MRLGPANAAKVVHSLPESTIYVVTFSGVTSGGMVTSGTMCWT